MTAGGRVLVTAFADAIARRSAFWAQVIVMAVNDLAWVAFWLIFFRAVPDVRGWDGDAVLLLFAVLTTAAGLALGVTGNCRRIPLLVAAGDLDEILTLPVAPLRHLLVRHVEPVNLGDAAFGVVLFAVAGRPTPERAAVYVAGTLLAAVLLGSFLVLVGSSVFLDGRGETSSLAMNAVLLLAGYPVDIFTGRTKALLYSVLPAAFVAAVPARLVDHPGLPDALALLGAATTFAVLGAGAFTLGLRRYTSGSAWRTH